MLGTARGHELVAIFPDQFARISGTDLAGGQTKFGHQPTDMTGTRDMFGRRWFEPTHAGDAPLARRAFGQLVRCVEPLIEPVKLVAKRVNVPRFMLGRGGVAQGVSCCEKTGFAARTVAKARDHNSDIHEMSQAAPERVPSFEENVKKRFAAMALLPERKIGFLRFAKEHD